MDAVHAVPACTKTLFWIQGTGQLNLPGVNWGDGFATDTILIQQYGLSDPNNFFQTLLTRPYLQQVGISPHIYPPMVSHAGQVKGAVVYAGSSSRKSLIKSLQGLC